MDIANLNMNSPEAIAKRREGINADKARKARRRKVRKYMNECRAPQLTVKLGSYWPEA